MNEKKLQLFLGIFFFMIFSSCNVTSTENNPENKDTVYVEDSVVIKSDSSITSTSEVNNQNGIDCDGIGGINFTDDYPVIEAKAGKENISVDSNFVEGEFQSIYHTLWKGTPKEIQVFWKDAYFKKQISSLKVENENSVYQFDNGIRVGTSLEQLVNLNGGEPVRFYGFNWDYGGRIMNFSEGTIRKKYDCLSGVLGYKNKMPDEFSGDREFNSSMPGLPLKDIYLAAIEVAAPHSD